MFASYHDLLYYGSVPVEFAVTEGTVTLFISEEWCDCSDTTMNTVKTVVFVPAIPAKDICPLVDIPGKDAQKLLPQLLRSPLIKVPMTSKGGIMGFASGTRSGLLKIENDWYRLKGCGNNAEGFVVRLARQKEGQKEIRGCAFPQTALRELSMAARLRHIGCNEPIGFATYNLPKLSPTGAHPTCILERTFGDRRLGTHVLAGLDLLLPSLIDVWQTDLAALLAHFPKGRDTRVTTAQLMSDQQLGTSYAIASTKETITEPVGLTWTVPRDDTLLANFLNAHIRERVPSMPSLPSLKWKQLSDAALEDYASAITSAEGKSILAYTFARLGVCAGNALRTLHDAGISWGTYQDSICHEGQYHCNAHSDNLVLLSEDLGRESLLGLLDLDMAYDRTTYTGKENFENILLFERVNLAECLAGANRPAHPSPSDTIETLKTGLYDTLILGFMAAYKGRPYVEQDSILDRASHSLIRLAIVVMRDAIA